MGKDTQAELHEASEEEGEGFGVAINGVSMLAAPMLEWMRVNLLETARVCLRPCMRLEISIRASDVNRSDGRSTHRRAESLDSW